VQDHALVRVTARPIHPADLSFIRGQYRIRPVFPQVAGLEGTGTIVEYGAGVALPQGARVAFRWPGTWAEYALVPGHRLIPVPDDIADDAAAQFSLNPVTAYALLESARVDVGDIVVVTAAASTVAGLVRALAHERGASVFGVVRGDAGRIEASFPAGAFSDSDPDLATAIQTRAAGRRVAAVIDCVGGPIVSTLLPAISPTGTIIAYGVLDSRPALVTNASMIYANLTWTGFGIDRWLDQREMHERNAAFDHLWNEIRRGVLTLPVASHHPLRDLDAALSDAERPQLRGKVLLM
jgi:NADPH:quinone reductase